WRPPASPIGRPQHHSVPSPRSAHVLPFAAATVVQSVAVPTRTGTAESTAVPLPSAPVVPWPQHHRLPSSRIAHGWVAAAARRGSAGSLHDTRTATSLSVTTPVAFVRSHSCVGELGGVATVTENAAPLVSAIRNT